MKVITVAQEKGGNCKTTTAVNMAVLLNKAGHKTLLIDADQQVNSTDTYKAEYEGKSTLYDCLLAGADPNECIQKTEVGDIIAGDPLLCEAEDKLKSQGVNGLLAFRTMISKIKGYDYVILDCPPNMGVYLQSIFISCDEIVVPVLASRYSLMGINHLVETVENIKVLNPNIKISGFLLCKFSGRANADKNVLFSLYDVAEKLNTKIFDAYIRETAKVREAELKRVVVVNYAPNCTAAKDYQQFVNEFLGGEK